ncbi:metal ABC transporter permease [Boudabousia marimammalium]|uniref:Zinc ABC transporter permease n=1 Tax=Boudabousia marimammalium TaxID=156892 RepID=A0A1Q5PM84_9ACTO|nr:metal ABC transporter permease [Boudabousia marimammalium]OKL48633.1 hypothetical protein BM477_05355 [Boudabousia marimammalium]
MTEFFTSVTDSFANGVEFLRLLLVGNPLMFKIADMPFLFRPFVLLMMLGIVAGVVGTLVNLRSLEFSAEAMVHSVFPGIVGGFVYLGGIEGIIPGALFVALLVTLGLTLLGQSVASMETATAVVLTAFFGIGIVMVTYHRDMSGQLESLLFGRLLAVTDADLAPAFAVCLLAILLAATTWRRQVARAFDPVGVAAQGVSIFWLDIALNLAVGLVVVAAATAVGALLVIGYLIIPGASGRLIGRSVRSMTIIATVVAIIGGYIGMAVIAVAVDQPISPQAGSILTLVAIYLILVAVRPILYKIRPEVREHAVAAHEEETVDNSAVKIEVAR